MKRKIIKIHEEKCNGCGACAQACHEGAIVMVDGKARLISDRYCDGLGNCLPACPTDAIEIIEREADAFDEAAVLELALAKETEKKALAQPELPCGCPGTMSKKIEKEQTGTVRAACAIPAVKETRESELRQWPVQLKLVNTAAEYFQDADLLIAADCTAYAYGGFHEDFIKGRVTVIGCPKLDDVGFYQEKLAEILSKNNIKSITVVRMEVPCCTGIVSAVKEAMLKSRTIVPYREIIITIDGKIK